MDLSPLTEIGVGAFALASVAVAVGALVQGSVGFGFALLAAPILVSIDSTIVPAPLIAVGMGLCILTAWRDHAAMDLSGLGYSVAGRVPGTIAGAWILTMLPADALGVLVGGSVLLGVAASSSPFEIHPGKVSLFVAGVLSGVMGTTTSVGGPPIALVYQNVAGDRLRATLAGFFVIGCVMSLSVLWLAGRFGERELVWALALMPAMLVGFAFSGRLTGYLDAGRTRRAVLVLCSAAGLVALLNSLR